MSCCVLCVPLNLTDTRLKRLKNTDLWFIVTVTESAQIFYKQNLQLTDGRRVLQKKKNMKTTFMKKL